MTKVIISDKLWVPRSLLKKKHVRPFEIDLFEDQKCAKCSNEENRPNYVCETCPSYQGRIQTWKFNSDKTRVGFPKGATDSVLESIGGDAKIIDKRVDTKINPAIVFTGNLYTGEVVKGHKTPNQVEIVDAWLKAIKGKTAKQGFLEARPRTGKTVMAVYIACKLQRKTLIVAHLDELLENFLKTYKKCTNYKKVGAKVKMIQKDSDFKNADVALCTYQKFLGKHGSRRIRKYAKKFGFIIIDEAHQAAATAYTKFVNSLPAKYMLALSATPERKDGRHVLSEKVIGPVLAKGETGALTPKIELWETGIKAKRDYKMWVAGLQFLAKSEERNKLIVLQVFKDLRAGRQSILIPVDFKHHVSYLVKLINHQAKINNRKRGENWPTNLACSFTGDTKGTDVRNALFTRIRDGDHRVTVAMRSMVKQGLDVDIWDTIYVAIPMNNKAMFYQLVNRICNVVDGKIEPVVRFMIDDMGMSLACFRNSWFGSIIPGLRTRYDDDKNPLPPLYKVDNNTFRRAMDIAKNIKDYNFRQASLVNSAKPPKPSYGLGKFGK